MLQHVGYAHNHNVYDYTPPRPAGTQAGDLLVAFAYCTNQRGMSLQGWNILLADTFNATGRVVAWKADDGDMGTLTWNDGFQDQVSITVHAVRGQDGASPIMGSSFHTDPGSSPNTTTNTGPSLTTVRPGALAVLYAGVRGYNGMSVQIDLTPAPDTYGQRAATYPQIVSGVKGYAANGSATAVHTAPTGAGPTNTPTWGATVLVRPANAVPSTPGAFTSPAGGATVDTTGSVAWGAATDADSDSLTYDAQLSTDGGAAWAPKRTKAAGLSFTYDYSSEPATTAARWRTRAWDGLAYGDWRESANFTIQHNVAPTGPSLVAPTNGGTADLAAGYTFRLTPQDADTSDSTIAYAFRRKVSGAASYEYWNAALAAWQITEVWNTVTAVPKGNELPVTFGSAKWTNATTYNWSARTRDALGVDGPYATDSTVTANIPPTVDVLQPSGTITTTSRPVVAWSYTDPENNPQDAYRVRVFTATQYGAGGFDPATSASVWDSGVVLSVTARDTQVGVDLEEGVQHRAYVQARQQLGSAWSAWAWELFTLQLERPVAPVVVVTPEPDAGLVRLDIAGTDDGAPYSAANTTVQVQWSDDGDTWTELRDSPAAYSGAFTATLYDREAPPGAQRLYRVRTVGDV